MADVPETGGKDPALSKSQILKMGDTTYTGLVQAGKASKVIEAVAADAAIGPKDLVLSIDGVTPDAKDSAAAVLKKLIKDFPGAADIAIKDITQNGPDGLGKESLTKVMDLIREDMKAAGVVPPPDQAAKIPPGAKSAPVQQR
jgi:hypothetical protein